jgi:hypothetical protein
MFRVAPHPEIKKPEAHLPAQGIQDTPGQRENYGGDDPDALRINKKILSRKR